MANKNLLDFPTATIINDNDYVHISQAGVDKKIKAEDALNITGTSGTAKVYNFQAGIHYVSGATSALTVPQAVYSNRSADIYFDGIYQEKHTYSVSVSSFVFSAPITASEVEIVIPNVVDIGFTSADMVSYNNGSVEDALNKSIKVVENLAALSSASFEIGQKIALLGHTIRGIGGGNFITVAATGLTSDQGTVVVNGPVAYVRTDYESLTPQMFGCLGTPQNDTNALKYFLNAIKNGAKASSSGIYDYSILSGGSLDIIGSSLNWDATNTTIRCIEYPNAGSSSQINFIDIAVNKINLKGLTVNGGWQYISNRTDSYCVTNNKFNYMHGLTLSCQEGFIDNVTVHDCEGLGITTESSHGGFKNIQAGKICAHHNWMVGVDIRSTSNYVTDSTINSIRAFNNGTRGGGWVGVNFGDNKSSAGTQSISVGTIHCNANGGSGVGIGQYGNPANGDVSGANTIQIGSIIANGNIGHGVEIYASLKVQVGSISASFNDKKGVYLERSDTNDLFGYVNHINSIISSHNGQEGVVISGVNHISIGGITSFNNGQDGVGYSGITLYSPNGLATSETGRVSISSIDTYDDQGSKTQSYGLNLAFYGAPTSYFQINSLNSYGNNVKDVFYSAFGNSKPIFLDNFKSSNFHPDYADNSRILFCVNGSMLQKWKTSNTTATATLLARPTPGLDCIINITVVGRKSDGTVLHIGQDTSAYKWVNPGFQKQAVLQSLVHKTSATDFYSNEFSTAVSAYVVGTSATDIFWDITMSSNTGFDDTFVI